jgi:vacuolar-type H+-ATPase subunit I/STV1
MKRKHFYFELSLFGIVLLTPLLIMLAAYIDANKIPDYNNIIEVFGITSLAFSPWFGIIQLFHGCILGINYFYNPNPSIKKNIRRYFIFVFSYFLSILRIPIFFSKI